MSLLKKGVSAKWVLTLLDTDGVVVKALTAGAAKKASAMAVENFILYLSKGDCEIEFCGR